MATILYLTDLYYGAKGREYFKEDLYITSQLQPHFNLLIGHPQQVLSYPALADLIVFRNTGPVIYYRDYFNRFVSLVNEKGVLTYNSFDGKADIRGKHYLLELTREGYPVIPTTDDITQLEMLGPAGQYLVKLIDGADSIGMELFQKEDLAKQKLEGKIIQPFLHFVHEVSFYYLDNVFQYALFAPDKKRRWELIEYDATPDDLRFAGLFVNWNKMSHGIMRIDACRLADGSLRLVEIEDLNPFLSLDLLSENKREQFIYRFIESLEKLLNQ